MSASSALPRCRRTEVHGPARARRVLDQPPPAHQAAAGRHDAQAPGRRPRGRPAGTARRSRRRRRAPTARYAMSAVAQRASRRPATLRSQSVGRRSAGSGTAMRPCEPRTSGGQAGEVGGQVGPPRRRRHHVVVEEGDPRRARPARQPVLRAAAGPAPRPPTTRASQPAAPAAAPRRSAGRLAGGRPPRSPRRAPGRRRRAGPRIEPAAGWAARPSGPRCRPASTLTRAVRRTRNGPMASGVDRRGAEALERVARVVDHRAPGRVEARVDHDRDAGAPLEPPRASAPPAARRSRSTVWMRAVPSTCSGGRDARRAHSGRTRWVKSMNGLGIGPSKISARPLGQHHRGDRAELLAALDRVEPVEVRRVAAGWPAGCGGRAPAARTRCGPGTTRPRRRRRSPRPPRRRRPPGARRAPAPRPGSPRSRRRPTRGRAPPSPSGWTSSPSSRATCRAAPERRARVARRRLHPDLVEGRALGQVGVGDAVQRHAARQRQAAARPCGRAATRPARAAPPGAGPAPTPARSRAGLGRAGAAPVDRRATVKPPSPVTRTSLAEAVEQPRPPVRREGHHLVLVGRPAEAEVLGQLLVEQAQRVRQRLDGEHLQVAAARRGRRGTTPARRARRAPSPRSRRKRRGEVRRRGVGDVVRHEADALGVQAGQRGRRNSGARCA